MASSGSAPRLIELPNIVVAYANHRRLKVEGGAAFTVALPRAITTGRRANRTAEQTIHQLSWQFRDVHRQSYAATFDLEMAQVRQLLVNLAVRHRAIVPGTPAKARRAGVAG
jgi:hypothetical protein